MGRKRCLGLDDFFVCVVLHGGADFYQGTQTGISGQENGSGYSVCITRLQIPGDKKFGRIIKVRHEIPARNQVPDPLGNKEGGGKLGGRIAFIITEHPYGNGNRVTQGITDIQWREILIKQSSTEIGKPGRLPEITTPVGRIDPAASGIFVQDDTTQINSAGR